MQGPPRTGRLPLGSYPEPNMATVFETLVHCATLAPSGHNTQPWTFSASADVIRIFPDFSRRLPVVDPDEHALYISLGCALENMVIAASYHGWEATVEYFPVDEPEPCLRVRLVPAGSDGSLAALYAEIQSRHVNRRRYSDRAIPQDQMELLSRTGLREGVEVKVFQGAHPEAMPLLELVQEANRLQFGDQAFMEELLSWIRFSGAEIKESRDGLSSRALGFPPVPRWLGRLIMTRLMGAEGEAKRQSGMLRSAPLSLLFIAQADDPLHWVALGRSFERTALLATTLGIAHAHVNMPCEVVPVRRKLAEWLQLDAHQQPLLLVRFGYAEPLQSSPRREVSQVMRSAWKAA